VTRVQGLDAFNRRFKAIPRKVREAMRYALEREAHDIVEDMFNLAPQGDTLRLAGSIGWTWGDAPAGTITVGHVGGREYGTLRITIFAGGDDAFYARFHEFGTRFMTANPFFFPVWRARRKRTRNRLKRALNKAIKES